MAKDDGGILNRLLKGITRQEDTASMHTYDSSNLVPRSLKNSIESGEKAISKVLGDTNKISNHKSIITLADSMNKKDKKDNKFGDKNLQDMLQDSSNMKSHTEFYVQNRSRQQLLHDFKLIKDYIPSVQFNLEDLTASIISPDDSSVVSVDIDILEEDVLSNEELSTIKDKYDSVNLSNKIINGAVTNGKHYVYCAPYKEVFTDAIENKTKQLNEAVKSSNSKVSITEHVDALVNETGEKGNIKKIEIEKYFKSITENISLDTQYSLPKFVVDEKHQSTKSMKAIVENTGFNIKDGELGAYDNIFSRRELLTEAKSTKTNDINIDGSVIKHLNPQKLIPIKLGSSCLGYYYLEKEEISGIENRMKNPFSNIKGNLSQNKSTKNQLTKQIADYIYKNLDNKMIEGNEEIKQELYDLVRYQEMSKGNNTIRYIPPEHVVEFSYNGGKSKLEDVVLTGKLYVALYLSAIFMKISRSSDKRVYYIKRGVDKSTFNTVKRAAYEIKKYNFNMDLLNDSDTMIRTLGKFDDLFIPLSNNGEKAIDFDILGGQDVDIDTELMEKLEQQILNGIGTPYALADSMQDIDYSRRLVMSNARFLRQVTVAQYELNKPLDLLFNKIIASESDSDKTKICKVVLPKSKVLVNETLSDQISSANDLANSILEILFSEDEVRDSGEDVRTTKFKILEDLTSGIDLEKYKRYKEEAILSTVTTKGNEEDDDSGGSSW